MGSRGAAEGRQLGVPVASMCNYTLRSARCQLLAITCLTGSLDICSTPLRHGLLSVNLLNRSTRHSKVEGDAASPFLKGTPRHTHHRPPGKSRIANSQTLHTPTPILSRDSPYDDDQKHYRPNRQVFRAIRGRFVATQAHLLLFFCARRRAEDVSRLSISGHAGEGGFGAVRVASSVVACMQLMK